MKVLLVAHHLPPRHVAGTEVYTARLARVLSERHEVTVFASDDDPALEPGTISRRREGRHDVVELAEPRVVREPSRSWSGGRAEEAFAALLAEAAPDVCHFQHLRFLSMRLPAIARDAGVPTLMTLHDYWLLCARDGQLVDRYGRLCPGPAVERCASCLRDYRFGLSPAEARGARAVTTLRRWTGVDLSRAARRIGVAARALVHKPRTANGLPPDEAAGMLDVIEARRAAAAAACSGIDVFIAPSEFLRAVFREAGVTVGRWEVVGHGVDGCPGGAPAPKAWGARPLRIGFAGLIAPPKGVDLLIRAAESLPEGSYEIDVHGRGDVRPEYAGSLVRQARGRPIRFHGAYEPGASARFMPGWDVAVAPSRWVENAPLAILEAQACGLPVVAADIGGMRELVTDGVNGRLFRAGSSESLAAVLRELIADRGLVDRLQRGVRPPPTLEAHAARIEELYTEAVAGGIG